MATLLHGDQVRAGMGLSTILADLDCETYSEAGYVYREGTQKWVSTGTKTNPGIGAVGAAAYAEHPTTELMSLAYNLKDGRGRQLWIPGCPPPQDLFDHIAAGKLLEAYNTLFEYLIWHFVCRRMGWPALDYRQLRCVAAKARAFSLPAPLDLSASVVGANLKDKTKGNRVIKRYCCPRSPTAKDTRLRVRPEEEIEQGIELYEYNLGDIEAESSVSMYCPDLSPDELDVWLEDQRINIRGVQVDVVAADAIIQILDVALATFDTQLAELTDGALTTSSEVQRMQGWLHGRGVHLDSLDEEAVTAGLKQCVPGSVEHQVLTIRQCSASAGVKKLYAIRRQASSDGRVRGLFMYYRAHTGRWSSEGFQLQNIQSGGPKMGRAPCCGHYFPIGHTPHCLACVISAPLEPAVEWCAEAADSCIKLLSNGNYSTALHYFGPHLFNVMGGCIRGLIIAAPGKTLMCSDYSAIEAVVLAVLAGEEWRIEVFRTHGKIYEMTASDITGIPFEDIVNHVGGSHPARKPYGKVPELACFGADTLVLTDSGWKRIVDISTDDKLHDGVGYVEHRGVMGRGTREAIVLDGIVVTHEHKFWYNNEKWFPAAALEANSAVLVSCYRAAHTLLSRWLPELPLVHPNHFSVSLPRGGTHFVYDILNCGPRNRFIVMTQFGPLIAHNSGYGGWIGAWLAFGAGEFFTEEEIKQLILKWRAASPMIVELWGGQWRKHPDKWEFTWDLHGLEGNAVKAILDPGTWYTYRLISYGMFNDVLYCRLPSGRCISYHEPRLSTAQYRLKKELNQYSISHMTYNTNPDKGPFGWIRVEAYGGSLTENCIAENTQVLTERGWVQIQEVLATDLVHDGTGFVCHGGLLFKGQQGCVTVDGVLMTPDHEVLTDDGWKTASQKPQPYRPDIRGTHGGKTRTQYWIEETMGVPMHVWELLRESSHRGKESLARWRTAKLRLFNPRSALCSPNIARYEQAPCVRRVAVDERPVPVAYAPSMEELRRSGDSGLPKVAQFFRELLGGPWGHVCGWAAAGPEEQCGRILPGQLPVGRPLSEREQHPVQQDRRHPCGEDDNSPSIRPQWYRAHYATVPPRSRLAPESAVRHGELPQQSRVYDLLNAGPRRRFVVRGDEGPFIVHNCCQAVARDILAHALKRVESVGYPVVAHVHDEIICEVTPGTDDICTVSDLEHLMMDLPHWAKGWPIKAAGGWSGHRYRKE